MKEVSGPRWLEADSDASDELRELLGSAGDDDPSSEELGGLGARLGPLLETAPAAPSAASALPSTLPLRLRLGIGIGLLGAAGILYTALRPTEVPTLERGLASTSRHEIPTERAAAIRPPTPTPAPTSEPRRVAPKPSASAPAPVESEILMLERAHSALRSGRAADALGVTLEHTRAYPRGKLSQEREVIAIEALTRLGRRSEAGARGEAFIRFFPTSSHARRVRSILGIAGDGGS